MSPIPTHSRPTTRTDAQPAKATAETSKTRPEVEEDAACRTPGSIARQLDEELDQSFPASDPPSMVRDAPATVCDETTMKPQTEPSGSRKKGGKAARHHH